GAAAGAVAGNRLDAVVHRGGGCRLADLRPRVAGLCHGDRHQFAGRSPDRQRQGPGATAQQPGAVAGHGVRRAGQQPAGAVRARA
nr:hypothetical protein [Tanacetum cinerariifolium]